VIYRFFNVPLLRRVDRRARAKTSLFCQHPSLTTTTERMAPTTTENDEKGKTILLTRHGRVKRVHDVVSKLFFDDDDDPVLSTRSKTWLRRRASSSSSSNGGNNNRREETLENDDDDGVHVALNSRANVLAFRRKSVVLVCSICRVGDAEDDDEDGAKHGVITDNNNNNNRKDIRARSMAFVDFAHDDASFLLVGLSNGRLEGYDCADVESPRLLFSRKVSRAPLVSIRSKSSGQRLGPKEKDESDEDGKEEEQEEEDVTIFAENGDVLRVDALEMKSHLYRLRMARKQFAHDFQPEKDDYNTLTGMVKFDGFKRIAPIRDGVCVGNVPIKCSEAGLRERKNKYTGLNALLNASDDDDDDDDDDEKDENKFGFVACGKFGTIAFVQASGGSKFGAVESVSMAAKKIFSFFAKKTKDIQKKRFDIVGDDDEEDDDDKNEESENNAALKPSKWKSAIVDGPRKMTNILISPDGVVLAATDLLGRVTTYDCKYGQLTTVSMIKGCRDSDVGFVDERELVVFSPHRGGGVLEYFPSRQAYAKPVQTEKELVVGRDSRILSSPRALGTLFHTNTIKAAGQKDFDDAGSYFLGPDGNIDRISISC